MTERLQLLMDHLDQERRKTVRARARLRRRRRLGLDTARAARVAARRALRSHGAWTDYETLRRRG